ncbi:cytochrome P450 [Marininema halotolerans]|uniref:Cytochrome P450 n=1 Tax=Marininema halotolerans TaxID=1155944 RepID=A0A1I6RIX1_9BACL|nr:cytochrome P450 [Marininema halotolerans]SFS64657.1 Cytochrome P450 [Marininema halotolerans]
MSTFHQIPGPNPASTTESQDPTWSYLVDPLGHMSTLYQHYGDVVAFLRGGNKGLYLPSEKTPGTVFAFGPKQTETILRNPSLFHSHSIMTPLFPECEAEETALRRITTGLFSYNGSPHQCQRKKVMPAFHRSTIERYTPDILRITHEISSTWKPDEWMDLARETTSLSLTILWHIFLGKTGMGHPQHLSNAQSWLEHLLDASRGITLNLPDNPKDRVREEASFIEDTFRRFWQEASKEDQSVLTQLCHHAPKNESLTETEAIGHLFTFVMAGYETVASSILWTLFLLASHPKELHNLTEEISGPFNGDSISEDEIRKLTHLDHVVKESLRLLPAAPICWRVAQPGAFLNPWEVPPGTEVIYSPFHTHRLPELYDQPQRFQPSRWAHIRPSPFEYLPFSAGPRKCIGASLATQVIKGVLITLLPRYHFQLPPTIDVNLRVGITLQPDMDFPVKLIPHHLATPTIPEIRGSICNHVQFH